MAEVSGPSDTSPPPPPARRAIRVGLTIVIFLALMAGIFVSLRLGLNFVARSYKAAERAKGAKAIAVYAAKSGQSVKSLVAGAEKAADSINRGERARSSGADHISIEMVANVMNTLGNEEIAEGIISSPEDLAEQARRRIEDGMPRY